MARKKEQIKQVVCLRLSPDADLKPVQLIIKATKSDASTIMRGLMRLGLAVYLKESETDKSAALLRVTRAGSFN